MSDKNDPLAADMARDLDILYLDPLKRVYTATALLVTGSKWTRNGPKVVELGQVTHADRAKAITDAFITFPSATEVRHGYGYNGSFDIQWTKRSP